MKRLKVLFYILTISGTAVAVISGCQSNAAREKRSLANKTEDSIYALEESERKRAAILSAPRTRQQQAELVDFFSHRLLRTGFNGAMLVAKKGVVIFEQYHGIEDYRSKMLINEQSSFQLASVSKTFTAMGILWLMERGQLRLEDTLQMYYPDFPYMGITIKTLLNHRSGLPNYLYFCDSLWEDKERFLTNNDVIRLMIQHKPPVEHQPDRHFQYCNTNYIILGALIEKISGRKYADFMRQTFFEPLGMHNTFVFDPSSTPRPHQTTSHKYNGRPEPDTYFDGVVGDKGIYSSALDMLKWDQALYSGELFKPETLEAAYSGYSYEKPGIRNYGLGWRLMEYPDSSRKIVYHNGWWHGNNTVFYRFIQDTSTLIILGNRYNRGIYQAIRPVRAILGHGEGEEEYED